MPRISVWGPDLLLKTRLFAVCASMRNVSNMVNVHTFKISTIYILFVEVSVYMECHIYTGEMCISVEPFPHFRPH
jgi:hypothetical protein